MKLIFKTVRSASIRKNTSNKNVTENVTEEKLLNVLKLTGNSKKSVRLLGIIAMMKKMRMYQQPK